MDRKYPLNNRLGLHYPAKQNFRAVDLQAWKPVLAQAGVGWLVLDADCSRAIPETFIRGLIEAGVQPVLHFKPSLDPLPAFAEINLLLQAYAKWGIRYAIFYDRPNARSSWPSSGWTQTDLVERFLDRYLPLAESAWQAGISPILPPLEPGGSYWDTAFLRSTLINLQRRKPELIRAGLGMCAYAWTFGRSLNWGAGGPQRWPSARPYLTPAGSQDQRGFRVFDWYRAIAQAVLGAALPTLLLEAGTPAGTRPGAAATEVATAQSIARLLASESVQDVSSPETTLEPLPEGIFGAALSLPDNPEDAPFAALFKALKEIRSQAVAKGAPFAINGIHPIRHYLLLPAFEWGVSEWHIDAIKPYVRKYRPTIGFSLEEAALAESVMVIASESEIAETSLNQLRVSGCKVERIEARGTSLATILAER